MIDSNIIKQYENIALSDKHLFKLLDGKNNLVLYPDLLKYDNIDQVLGKYGICTLLFEAKKNYGHWCCLWKLNPDTVSFFNSYGGYPDDSLEYIPEHFAKVSNQDRPYLSLLLEKSPYNLTYNEHEYQKKGSDIKTCGRHVCVRLICRKLTDKQYYDYVKHFTKKYDINPDEFVTLLTMDVTK
jgi:hypothetical protein